MDSRFEELKSELFGRGQEAIEDFLGYEIDLDEDKDVTDRRMDMVYEQMPDDILNDFYKKYEIGSVSMKDKEESIRNLAGRLVDFMKDYDFYQYQDTLGPGGDEEAVQEIEKELGSVRGIRSLGQAVSECAYESDLSDNQKTEAWCLIEDLRALEAILLTKDTLDALIKDAKDKVKGENVSSVPDKGEVGLEF